MIKTAGRQKRALTRPFPNLMQWEVVSDRGRWERRGRGLGRGTWERRGGEGVFLTWSNKPGVSGRLSVRQDVMDCRSDEPLGLHG